MTQSIDELLSLDGKTALITGGSKGIGEAIVSRLHEAGANVVIADVDLSTAEVVAKRLNGVRANSAIAVTTDVRDEESVKQAVEETVKAFGALDILVNDAGIFPVESIADMSLADFERVVHTNLRGSFLTMKYASKQMIAQGRGGKIINVTSIDALHPSMVGLAHYDASKHGLWGLTKNAALEMAEHNIWVNAIAPGGVLTPGVMGMSNGDESAAQTNTDFGSTIPMKRIGEPDDIGKVALFLASDMASYMTGSQVVVDGGALLK